MRRDWLGFLVGVAREYGDCAAFRLGPQRVVLVSHPDWIEQVLVRDSRGFGKTYFIRLLRPVLGDGLLTSEGNHWLRQRRLAQPAFHRARLAGYAGGMVACVEELLDGWRDGEVRDIHAEMMALTLRIVARSLFGADVAGETEEVGAAVEVLMDGYRGLRGSLIRLPRHWPTPGNRRLQRAARRLDDIVYGIIHQRREGAGAHDDLLSLLLGARDDQDGSGMSDRQVRDEVMTLFLAGHETTANALTWTWLLLARHPDAAARLVAETAAVLGDRAPTVEDVPRLTYTECVVRESLRLYPPAYVTGRAVREGCRLGDYWLPPGTTLLMSQWVVHRDPRFFADPEEFAPERWSNDLARRLPRFAYFPFGGGPRQCIGSGFAVMDLILLLAAISRRFRLALVPGQEIVPSPSITLRPREGIRMRLHRC